MAFIWVKGSSKVLIPAVAVYLVLLAFTGTFSLNNRGSTVMNVASDFASSRMLGKKNETDINTSDNRGIAIMIL